MWNWSSHLEDINNWQFSCPTTRVYVPFSISNQNEICLMQSLETTIKYTAKIWHSLLLHFFSKANILWLLKHKTEMKIYSKILNSAVFKETCQRIKSVLVIFMCSYRTLMWLLSIYGGDPGELRIASNQSLKI